jgi:hypothetical protein
MYNILKKKGDAISMNKLNNLIINEKVNNSGLIALPLTV